jgi:hypothetical protein
MRVVRVCMGVEDRVNAGATGCNELKPQLGWRIDE